MENKWSAAHYLKYGDERTRAASDLATSIRLDSPGTVADLGCGPGNSTQILRQRWPQAEVVGVDNSVEMIDAARASFPQHRWQLADISDWKPAEEIDLVYSNAALQWLPNHQRLIGHLFTLVAEGGGLAFQIPSGTFAAVRRHIHEVSRRAEWTERMEAARNALTMESPEFYYDVLSEAATQVDIWETEYHHVVDSQKAVVDWMASTGLRPFLAALGGAHERTEFLTDLQARVDASYESRLDGKVLFPFRRTFVIAYR